jgi:hypothetical protein
VYQLRAAGTAIGGGAPHDGRVRDYTIVATLCSGRDCRDRIDARGAGGGKERAGERGAGEGGPRVRLARL